MMELEDVETEHQMDHRVHFQKYLDERTCYFICILSIYFG